MHLAVQVQVDRDDQKSPGRKYNQYELQGVPVRIAIGARDVAANKAEIFRRDTGEKTSCDREEIANFVVSTLHDMQSSLYAKNKAMREANTVLVDTYEEFQKALDDGKFVLAHWDGTVATEELIKDETKATIRCIPASSPDEAGQCIRTGQPSMKRVLFARAY